jgi:UDP-N-acetylglucosamine--N-acetylmuramyl-(pentapeptide) pyrophosphoryl-undecaprenol N-acetylglucosamine transferase
MKLLLAGGGTAGHIEPALAVGRGWLKSHPGDEIAFLGTSSGLEISLIPAAGFPVLEIPKVAIARSLSSSLLKVPFQLVSAVTQTMKHLEGVDCAIGFGGYVSAPLYFAAFLKRVPLVIHEQNAKPGWANRLGARFTRFTATSYPVHVGALKKAELTGLPLRSDVVAAIESAKDDWSAARRSAKSSISEKYGFEVKRPLIFIFGGSQGSQAINKVIAEARPALESLGYSILHGVGKNNEVPAPSAHYQALSYINEMAECYLAADLLIARSGAVTCAEANALSKFSLFIPLPVGNGEQALNAESLVAAGRAHVVTQADFTPEWLTMNIADVVQKSSRRSDVADTSGVNAVDKILHIIERALRGR